MSFKHEDIIEEKIKRLPQKTGCYLMKGLNERILYIGKAKNLRSRVLSYFSHLPTLKTKTLLSHVVDIDFMMTSNETEALILENNLIKKYSPRYNILLRDDKSYPYVEVNFQETYPKLEYTRRPKRGKQTEVFGPFVHNSHIGETLRAIMKVFKLRDCSNHEFRMRNRPCLLYQIKQCSAPCVKLISSEEYGRDVSQALNFFRGKHEEIITQLKDEMNEFSLKEEYEHAATLRDNIKILEDFIKTSNRQHVELHLDMKDFDVLAFYEGGLEVDVAIYLVRNNLLLGHKVFHFPLIDCKEDLEEEVLTFVLQYYENTQDSLPKKIFSSFSSETFQLFKKVMKIKKKGQVNVSRPTKDIRPLLKLTAEYAREHQRFRMSNREILLMGLAKLKELLSMKENPSVIECFDIAIFQGTSPAASQVVFKDGEPLKSAYRHYHLTERPEGNNDFAMMEEVFTRRINYGNFPNLFVVDGGVGQVSAAKTILKEKNISIPVIGIAKADAAMGKEERLIIPGYSSPYFLRKNRPLMKILTHLRDEAHRFSRRLHHKQESKRYFSSWIDGIEGLGPKTKKKILEKLDVPISEIARMPPQFISRKLGIKERLAKKIFLGAKRMLEE